MIVDTHLLISNIIYKYISKNMKFKLDRVAFAYGNIKPDFTNSDIKCPHTLEESLYRINKYSEILMREDISVKQFSIYLGVICHFTCDYFCLYHRNGYSKKGILEHLYYELILHMKLLALLLRGKLRINNYDVQGNSVEAILLKLQEKYISEVKGINRDINYTLLAATQISKLIVYSRQLNFKQTVTTILEEHQMILYH